MHHLSVIPALCVVTPTTDWRSIRGSLVDLFLDTALYYARKMNEGVSWSYLALAWHVSVSDNDPSWMPSLMEIRDEGMDYRGGRCPIRMSDSSRRGLAWRRLYLVTDIVADALVNRNSSEARDACLRRIREGSRSAPSYYGSPDLAQWSTAALYLCHISRVDRSAVQGLLEGSEQACRNGWKCPPGGDPELVIKLARECLALYGNTSAWPASLLQDYSTGDD